MKQNAPEMWEVADVGNLLPTQRNSVSGFYSGGSLTHPSSLLLLVLSQLCPLSRVQQASCWQAGQRKMT